MLQRKVGKYIVGLVGGDDCGYYVVVSDSSMITTVDYWHEEKNAIKDMESMTPIDCARYIIREQDIQGTFSREV